MPRRPGQRRLTAGRSDAQPKDDQADDSAIPDQVWAAEAKRAKRQRRTRGVLEMAGDIVAEFIGSLLP